MSIFYNLDSESLSEELQAAWTVGARPIVVPSDAFLNLAATGERLVYAVVDDVLLVSGLFVQHHRITHAVLAAGRPVSAAGEVELLAEPGFMVVMELNNRSGHYQPDRQSLEVAKAAFEARGFRVPDESIRPYTQEGA